MRYRTTTAALAAALLVLGGTAACSSGETPAPSPSPTPAAEATPNGVEDLKADEILKRASAAVSEAQSVKASATTEQEAGTTSSLNLSLTRSGAQGTLSSGESNQELIATEGTIYLKGDDQFNQGVAGANAEKLTGKWVSVPAESPEAGSLRGLTSIGNFFSGLLTPASAPTKVKPKQIDGVRCVGLKSQNGTLWVATTGEPFPIAVESEAATGGVQLTEWNAPVTITAPPAEEVVPYSEVQPSPQPTDGSPAPSPTAS